MTKLEKAAIAFVKSICSRPISRQWDLDKALTKADKDKLDKLVELVNSEVNKDE